MWLDDLDFQPAFQNQMWDVAKLARCEVWRSNDTHPNGMGVILLHFPLKGDVWQSGGFGKNSSSAGLEANPLLLCALLHEYSKP
jgi:hypothetical protein